MGTTSREDKNYFYKKLMESAANAQTWEHERAEAARRTAKWQALEKDKRNCSSCQLSKQIKLSLYCTLKMKYITANNLCCFWKGTDEEAKEIVWID